MTQAEVCYDQDMGNVLDDPFFGAVLFVFRDFKDEPDVRPRRLRESAAVR
jgi:hypothetical protein